MKLLISIVFVITLIPALTGQDVVLNSQNDSASYSIGVLMGTNIKNAGVDELNEAAFMRGIKDAAGTSQLISPEQANMFLNKYMSLISEKKAAENLAKGQKFLEENAKAEGVVSLPSGLQYKVIKEGEGSSPVDTSFVTVHYKGSLIDGSVFDSSIERGEPAQFQVNEVIPGWTEALKLMKKGATWLLYIPPALAYGERGVQTIGPNSVLIFNVELIDFQ